MTDQNVSEFVKLQPLTRPVPRQPARHRVGTPRNITVAQNASCGPIRAPKQDVAKSHGHFMFDGIQTLSLKAFLPANRPIMRTVAVHRMRQGSISFF